MKMNCWLILGVMVATSATAQNSTNALPEIPPPAVGAATEAAPAPAPEMKPAAPVEKKAVRHKKKTSARAVRKAVPLNEPTVNLLPGPAEVVATVLNVRGQAGLKGEVVTHVKQGDTVTVLSEITLDKHKVGEPAQWAKIALPTNVNVWVSSRYIDKETKTVKPKRLNLRAGPGENYSVLGVIDRGATVNEIGAKGGWSRIEAPASAYAFVAAMYLKQEASATLPTNPAPSTETESVPPTPETVPESQPVASATETQIPTNLLEMNSVPPPAINPMVIVQTNIIVVTNHTPPPPPPPRIVTHEGVVRRSISLVAPTYFELYDPSTGETVNYLYSTTTNLNLARYNGLRIDVTGEEGLDARWKDTPVLTVQKIYVLGTNAPAATGAKGKTNKPWYHFW